MRRAVAAYESGAIDGESDRQVLQRDVVDQLVVRALQERRVDGDDGAQALARHARGQRDGVLFGDGDVEVAIGKALGIFDQAGAFAHGGRDADDALIGGGDVAQPLAEHLRVARAARFLLEDHAALRIEWTGPVPLDRIRFGWRVALALARDHVEKLRALEIAQILERGDQCVDVVTVDGTDVVEAHLLEDRAWQHHAFHVLFGPARELPHRRHAAQHFLAALAQGRIQLAGEDAGEVIGERADVLRNRHVVVVQHDEHVDVEAAGVIQRFERHAGAQRAVADHGYNPPRLAFAGRSDRHAQCGADRGA